MEEDVFNYLRERLVKRIISKADREEPIDGDLIVVTLQRYEDDEETDHIICYGFPVGPPNVILKGQYRTYEVLNWDWQDTVYGFVLKVI